MASLALGVKFNATSSGLGDFVDFSAAQGYVRGSGNLVDGKTYRYRAESADLSQWEFGTGIWTAASNTLARTTITLSSTGAKVSFSASPVVGVVPFPADILQFDDAMTLTSAQKLQARSNIGIPIGQIPGTTTNDSATAGNSGEIISSSVALASAVSLVSTTATNITSVPLTAGDWDVSATFYNTVQAPFSAVTTWSYTRGSISLTSATMDFTAGSFLAYPALGATTSSDFAVGIPAIRLSLSATTTVYLVEQVNYTGGSVGGFGLLKARRMR